MSPAPRVGLAVVGRAGSAGVSVPDHRHRQRHQHHPRHADRDGPERPAPRDDLHARRRGERPCRLDPGPAAEPRGPKRSRSSTSGTTRTTGESHTFSWVTVAPGGLRGPSCATRGSTSSRPSTSRESLSVPARTATAPTVTTTVANTMVVRIAGIGNDGNTHCAYGAPPSGSARRQRRRRTRRRSGRGRLGPGERRCHRHGRLQATPTPTGSPSPSPSGPSSTPSAPTLRARASTTLTGGIVNTYYPGTATASAGAVSIAVGTARGATTPTHCRRRPAPRDPDAGRGDQHEQRRAVWRRHRYRREHDGQRQRRHDLQQRGPLRVRRGQGRGGRRLRSRRGQGYGRRPDQHLHQRRRHDHAGPAPVPGRPGAAVLRCHGHRDGHRCRLERHLRRHRGHRCRPGR